MAESLSHTFGQIIGEILEIAIQPKLQKFATKHKLFLDKKGERLTRKGKKLTWIDSKENKHDLDFVLERGGTDEALGVPIAFIETAWRRYTKHSRNKAQEIQGAIIPLSDRYRNSYPFLGVVLAGEFTKGSLDQLKSLGFSVLYFPYPTIIKAFKKFGINAGFDETTSEKDFRNKIKEIHKVDNKEAIAKEFLRLNKKEVENFFDTLEQSVSRNIETVLILPMYGKESAVKTIGEAILFLENYSEDNSFHPLVRYEIIIRYNTGDKIDATFKDKADAIKFLQIYV